MERYHTHSPFFFFFLKIFKALIFVSFDIHWHGVGNFKTSTLIIASELVQPLLILNLNDPDKITAWDFLNFANSILTTLFTFP